MKKNILAVAMLLLGLALSAAAQSPESVYTSLSSKACKTVKADQQSEFSVQSCPGIAGYKLLLAEDDLRQSITVVAPNGKKHSLEYWSVVTSGFSTLGEKAEWRVTKGSDGKLVPIALIVRVNANETPDDEKKVTSYLAVTKITPQKICVTDKIKPGATQNEEARRAADASAAKSCLE
ncbi:MAG: hypothetical protein HY231_10365 [Acidobacteria bacterium]|nr:hypothetical protein [Acidobacteriota bacterium]